MPISVVLARAGFDWARGFTGAAAAIFPALSDEATRQEFSALTESFADGRAADVFLREGEESAWLLGAPFFIQVIEGVGDAVAHIVGGVNDSLSEGRKQLESAWLFTEKRKVFPRRWQRHGLAGPAGCTRSGRGGGQSRLLRRGGRRSGYPVSW